MILSNFHTHTYRCKHAGGTDIELVDVALNHKLSILGFSDHAPYPDDQFGLRMDYNELDEYVTSIKTLKEKYKSQLDIRLGLEIEYDPAQMEYYDYLLNHLNLDYLAMGQHMYPDSSADDGFTNIYFIEDTAKYIDYAHSLCEAMKTGLFAFIAHPDVIFINPLPWDDNCEQASNLIVACAKEHDCILEFNANGIRRGLSDFPDGKRYPYPHKRFWEKVAQAGIRTIVNSDCHSPDQLWDQTMKDAFVIAKDWQLHIVNDII